MPVHFQRLCSAIDQLSSVDFDVPPPPRSEATGLSQSLETPTQSATGYTSEHVEEVLSSTNAKQQGQTPDNSCTGPGVTKRRKG